MGLQVDYGDFRDMEFPIPVHSRPVPPLLRFVTADETSPSVNVPHPAPRRSRRHVRKPARLRASDVAV